MPFFLAKKDVTKLQLELSIDPGTIRRGFADDFNLLSRERRFYPLFDDNSVTSMDSDCECYLDLTAGVFKPKFDVL